MSGQPGMVLRAAASVPAGVRFVFLGEPAALEIDYRTETCELGYRGAGAGTEFVAFRGERRVDAAAAQLGEGTARLRIGEGPAPRDGGSSPN